MQRDKAAVLQAPVEPCRGEAESRRSWKAPHLIGCDLSAQQCPHAIKVRIARAQNADGRTPAGKNDRDGISERRRPNHGFASKRAREREMAGASYDKFGLSEQISCGRRNSFETILANADQREPFFAMRRGRHRSSHRVIGK